MPINAELAAQRADSLQARQDSLVVRLGLLERAVEGMRGDQLRQGARSIARIQALEDQVAALAASLQDLQRLLAGRTGAPAPSRRSLPPEAGESRSAVVDTAAASRTTLGTDTLSAGGVDTVSVREAEEMDESGQLFRIAYVDFAEGHVDLAIREFTDYIERYPEGAQVDEAHYYLAETYLTQRRYLEAVGEYLVVIRAYPKSPLVPASYLKAGRCYEELGELELAERTWRELIDRFPHTEEAAQARDALERLGG
jgi:tol-pal system protein YbgF